MDKFLRPDRFDGNPHSPTAAKEWTHWLKTFETFLHSISAHKPNELDVLVNYLSPAVYDYIAEATDYASAIAILRALYIKPKNEVFARHLLASRRQGPAETIDEFLQALRTLSKDCNFQPVSAATYRDEYIRDAFISGLSAQHIRQRLLENSKLDLQSAYSQARSLESAQRHNNDYFNPGESTVAAAGETTPPLAPTQAAASHSNTNACYFCGNKRHPRHSCPARDATCSNCGKRGHYKKVCRSSPSASASAATTSNSPTLATTCSSTSSAVNATVSITVVGKTCNALVDTGSSETFISKAIAEKCSLVIRPSSKVSLWPTHHSPHL